jgi:hypothetical protein
VSMSSSYPKAEVLKGPERRRRWSVAEKEQHVNFASHGVHEKKHHIAFEVTDWAEIQRACDFLGTTT